MSEENLNSSSSLFMTYYLPEQTRIIGLILMKLANSGERMVHSITYKRDARLQI